MADIQIPIARPITEEERDGWLEAAGRRNPPRDRDIKTLRRWLFNRSPRRYRKLAELMRWAEGEYFREYGLYPEDARWLLP